MAHPIAPRPPVRKAAAVNPRRTAPNYRKIALMNSVRLALAVTRQAHLAVLARRPAAPARKPKVVPAAPVRKPKVVPAAPVRKPKVIPVAPVRKPKVVPAASLPWCRKPSLAPNRSMWARPSVQVADLSSMFDKMTLDSVPRGAVDELSDKLGKLSVQDKPSSAVDELSAAFARLTLDDPAVGDLTTSSGSMFLEQRSPSLDHLARLLGKCSLGDNCIPKTVATPEEPDVGPGTELEAISADASKVQVNVDVDEIEVPTTPIIAADVSADSDDVQDHEAICLPPLSVSDFATSGIVPLGTRPEDWLPAAESPSAIERVHLADSTRIWTPFTWSQEPVLDVLMRTTIDRRPAYEPSAPTTGILTGFLERLFSASTSTSSRSASYILPLHQSSVSDFSPNSSTSSSGSSTYSGDTSFSKDSLSESSASAFAVDLSAASARSSSSAPGFFATLKRVFGWSA